MNKKNLLGLLIFIAALLIGAFFVIRDNDNSNNTAENTKELTKISVGHINLANDLPAFIAQEKGYFTEEGLEVDLKRFDSSKLATDALYSGEIDASAGSSTVSLLAAESTQSNKAKIYALGFTGNSEETTLGAFVSKQDSDITEARDLEGKKVAIFPGGTAKILLTRYLDNENVDTSSIEWVEQVPSLWVASLQNGAVDSVFAYESALTIFKQDTETPVNVFSYGALESEIDPLYLGGSTVSTDFMDNDPESAKAYIKAFYRGIDFIENNEAEAREILAKFTGTKPEVATEMNLYPDAKLSDIQKDKFQALADLLFDNESLTEKVDTSSMYVDESFTP